MNGQNKFKSNETNNKRIALKHFLNGETVWYMYIEGSGSIADCQEDIIEHDEDGYFIIESKKLHKHSA